MGLSTVPTLPYLTYKRAFDQSKDLCVGYGLWIIMGIEVPMHDAMTKRRREKRVRKSRDSE